jgi:RAB protein geranylgeranyltransferase component A
MKKQELKKDQVNWLKMKLLNGGENGMEIHYSYLMTIKGRGFIKNPKITCDVIPHDDFIRLFKQLKPIVAKIENIDYVRKLSTIPGFDTTENQQRIIESMAQQSMESIKVTGISISERRKSEGIIISYLKYDINENVTGTSTTWINLEGNEYGIEEDLMDIVEDMKNESYSYEFEEKYADFEQLSMEFEDVEEENIEEAVAEEINE